MMESNTQKSITLSEMVKAAIREADKAIERYITHFIDQLDRINQ